MEDQPTYPYKWRGKDHPELINKRCRRLQSDGTRCAGTFRIQFEFEDGYRIVAAMGSVTRVTR